MYLERLAHLHLIEKYIGFTIFGSIFILVFGLWVFVKTVDWIDTVKRRRKLLRK